VPDRVSGRAGHDRSWLAGVRVVAPAGARRGRDALAVAAGAPPGTCPLLVEIIGA